MNLLLCTLAAAEHVEVSIVGREDPALPLGLSVDLGLGLTSRMGAGLDLTVTSLGEVGPSWLYIQGNASLALLTPEVIGNEMGWKMPPLATELRLGLIRSTITEASVPFELSSTTSAYGSEWTSTSYPALRTNYSGAYLALATSHGSLFSACPGIGFAWGTGGGEYATAEGYGARNRPAGKLKSLTIYIAPSSIPDLPVIPGVYFQTNRWATTGSGGMGTSIGLGVVPTRIEDEDIDSPNHISYVPLPTVRMTIGYGLRKRPCDSC